MKIPGMNLETDADIAVYLRNAALAIGEISKATGCRISICSEPEGYKGAEFGAYTYICFKDYENEEHEKYEYRPLLRAGEDVSRLGCRKISPSEINLKGRPKKCAKAT